jgi:hypothetical protein
MLASSGVNTQRRYFRVMTDIGIELVILVGVVGALVALGVALLRNKQPDPKMAFLLALLKDLPAADQVTQESDESGDAHDTAELEPRPASRISDFFA